MGCFHEGGLSFLLCEVDALAEGVGESEEWDG